jgi:hypothetical protein
MVSRQTPGLVSSEKHGSRERENEIVLLRTPWLQDSDIDMSRHEESDVSLAGVWSRVEVPTGPTSSTPSASQNRSEKKSVRTTPV